MVRRGLGPWRKDEKKGKKGKKGGKKGGGKKGKKKGKQLCTLYFCINKYIYFHTLRFTLKPTL